MFLLMKFQQQQNKVCAHIHVDTHMPRQSDLFALHDQVCFNSDHRLLFFIATQLLHIHKAHCEYGTVYLLTHMGPANKYDTHCKSNQKNQLLFISLLFF